MGLCGWIIKWKLRSEGGVGQKKSQDQIVKDVNIVSSPIGSGSH